jgi:arsenate reductase-like glutaredoxin family protein
MMTLYGIKSCDTCRKARQAAEKAGKSVIFVDVRDTPLTQEQRARFLQAFGDALVNRKSTTWRGLSEAERGQDNDKLLAAHPTLMKRPVIEGETLTLGWNAEVQNVHLG